MNELLQEINQVIKDFKRLRLCTVALLILTTLFLLYLCYMQQWALVLLDLLCGCHSVKLICDITDELKEANAYKIRMEFCIDVLGEER